jgi:hypothetical protein
VVTAFRRSAGATWILLPVQLGGLHTSNVLDNMRMALTGVYTSVLDQQATIDRAIGQLTGAVQGMLAPGPRSIVLPAPDMNGAGAASAADLKKIPGFYDPLQ